MPRVSSGLSEDPPARGRCRSGRETSETGATPAQYDPIVDFPIDPATLSPIAQRILGPTFPAPMRQMAAKGIAPGVKPGEALTIIVLLTESADAALAATAMATLDALPAQLLSGALAADLPTGVLAVVAPRYARNDAVMEKILAQPSISPATVAVIAEEASELVAELVATNEQRLLANPQIIEKIYMNRATRMSTADRILELAVRNKIELHGIPAYKEAALAIGQELICEPTEERTPDDIHFIETAAVADQTPVNAEFEDTHHLDEETGEEVIQSRFLPLHARLASMTISQKIRRAMLGTASERLLLVRDSNRLVAQAAIKSPAIQENEVVRISGSRNVSDDVLRTIALDREWTRAHQVKLNLVQNPRTPFAFAARLIQHLREHEIKALARSKNVTGAISTAARQQLARRKMPD